MADVTLSLAPDKDCTNSVRYAGYDKAYGRFTIYIPRTMLAELGYPKSLFVTFAADEKVEDNG